ncbi:MAG: endonuclease III [Candidatus Aenigmarchaeota archaeon]|nr:endonuclease III [Candidatus Aenigmarchaeota archaeon]
MNRVKKLTNFLEKRYGYPETGRTPHFQLLISTVLSQRTRDENTAKASKQLFSVARTPQAISKLPLKKIEKLIKPSGTYRQKALHIKKISKIILKDYKGRVPKTREELMKLPGVGYKTADVTLSYGFGVKTIAVDVHVGRIPKRIGIVDKKANVEEVRKILESLIKGRKRFLVNMGLVRFGQEICKPINPKCPECPLNIICNYYKKRGCVYEKR